MLAVVAFSMSMIGTFLVRSGILTSVHAFAVDPERGSFILALLAIYIGGAMALFGLRASTVTEGAKFKLFSREGSLVMNNVLLVGILGIVLIGTLYPLLTEAMGTKVSVGPPYFNPVGAVFVFPMLVIMAAGPLMRWRSDNGAKIGNVMAIPALVSAVALLLVVLMAGDIGLLPTLGLTIAAGLAVASFMPLWKRNLRRTPLHIYGMVLAHFGIAVGLAGMASESAFNTEKLVASEIGGSHPVGPWTITLEQVKPIAGPNWTALEGRLIAQYGDNNTATVITPQARMFTSPPTETSEAALLTRWNGQLYAVLGEEASDGRWQLRLWWKPFVPLIWYGGILVALGGLLAMTGRTVRDLKIRNHPEAPDFAHEPPQPETVPAKQGVPA